MDSFSLQSKQDISSTGLLLSNLSLVRSLLLLTLPVEPAARVLVNTPVQVGHWSVLVLKCEILTWSRQSSPDSLGWSLLRAPGSPAPDDHLGFQLRVLRIIWAVLEKWPAQASVLDTVQRVNFSARRIAAGSVRHTKKKRCVSVPKTHTI